MTNNNLALNSSKFEISQVHPIAFFFRKIIPLETRYKTRNHELLTIVEAFKTWCHYFKGCKYELFILTVQNNLYLAIHKYKESKLASGLMGSKNLSVPISNRLLSGKDKCGCRRLVTLFSEE